MDSEQIELTLPASPKPKYAHLFRTGAEVARLTWVGGGKPRESGKLHLDDRRAERAFHDEIRRRMAEGYVVLGERATAEPGELILECAPRGMCRDVTFDLAPDGRTLTVATWDSSDGAWIYLVDVATGVQRTVHTEPPGPHYPAIDAVLFGRGGDQLVYTVNDETRRLDLSTGRTEVLADCPRPDPERHTYLPQPSFDAARERVFVFDAGQRALVLDTDGKPLLDLDTTGSGVCFRGRLSPSGRLLALAFDDAGVIEIWDVDTGERTARLRSPYRRDGARFRGVAEFAFHPGERLLLVNGWHPDRLRAVDIETEEVVPVTSGEDRCSAFAVTPDGTRLALAEPGGSWRDGRIAFRDAESFEEAPGSAVMSTAGRVRRIAFSADGTLMVTGSYRDRVSVYAVG
ncbi:WD40 repeat domain-containing protein [Phytomonospora sp. NPDC050363]|uniref:WD40 repeat domain-containing protein n=1 Tax=Phytomonospora sp. NPDC050363 TaxID=3155642 RepID=UPI0033D31D64